MGKNLKICNELIFTEGSFGCYLGESESSIRKSILLGPGLGHAFISLEDNENISYLLSSPYSPEFEYGIHPMDPELNIDWSLGSGLNKFAVISARDLDAPTLETSRLEGRLP